MTVCLWDVNSYTKARNTIEPTAIYKGHTSVVGVSGPIDVFSASVDLFARQDVDWNPTEGTVFASVGDDKLLLLYVHPLDLESSHAYTQSWPVVPGGIPDLQQNQLQKSRRMIEKSLLVPSILPTESSLSLVVQTR